MNSRFTSILPGQVMNVLRTSKAEVNERLKMFQHSGFFRHISPKLKTWIRRSFYNRNGYVLLEDSRAALAYIRELCRNETNRIDNPLTITFFCYTNPRADGISSELR